MKEEELGAFHGNVGFCAFCLNFFKIRSIRINTFFHEYLVAIHNFKKLRVLWQNRLESSRKLI